MKKHEPQIQENAGKKDSIFYIEYNSKIFLILF